MQLIVLLALIQAPDEVYPRPVTEKPLNDTLTVAIVANPRQTENETELRVHLINRRRSRDTTLLITVQDERRLEYRIIRTDDSTIVIGREDTYQSLARLKLFLDPRQKFVAKRIDYPPDIGLRAVDEREVTRVLEVDTEVVQRLKRTPVADYSGDQSGLPRELREHPMPQSTYAEFARARPKKVREGPEYRELEEQPVACQVVGSRIWFGKAFREDEGIGVGGLGYFDTITSNYTFLDVPGLADWSTSALLIEEDAAWIGLAAYPEGETLGGGVLRYDFKSRTSRRVSRSRE